MATMMPPVFSIPPPSTTAAPLPFRSGPPPSGMPPPIFNPSMPPPAFNPSVPPPIRLPTDSGSSSSGSTPAATPVIQIVAATPGNSAFGQRSYRFKPPQTVNLAEAEGYGRRLRRNMVQVRRHIDAVASVLNYIEDRAWQSGHPTDQQALQPHMLYSMEAAPPNGILDKPVDCVTTKFVRSAMNKVKCPIYDICWTPEGRRLVTGASSGEFTLWNGTAFNFETILQAHDTAVRAIKWSHNDQWMVSADHDGYIKYWQSNMNNVTMFQAHKEAVRSVSFCPSDAKFATASDDGTVRVWDFIRCQEEKILRGHGSDVRCVDWHPRKALLVSGSRDSQQPVKLWDPRTSHCLSTLHDHKNAVMAAQWNENGNWLITGSRDHLVKLYDIRMMKEMMSFRGHKKEVTSLQWHPTHEGLLVSGGADGTLLFWSVTNDKEIGIIESAHDQAVWTLKWHPLGHILASGSNDNNTKFWTRNKPGDTLDEFYILTANPYEQVPRIQTAIPASTTVQSQSTAIATETIGTSAVPASPSTTTSTPSPAPLKPDMKRPSISIIPGMGLEGDILEKLREMTNPMSSLNSSQSSSFNQDTGGIPGLGGIDSNDPMGGRRPLLKQPPPKKAQREFERVWNVNSQLQRAMLGPADEPGPPAGLETIDYRKPKPSLLGTAPPEPSSLGSNRIEPPLSGANRIGHQSITNQPLLPQPQQTQIAGPWLDQSGGDIWRDQQTASGLFLSGSNLVQPQQYASQRHGQLQSLLPTPENVDTGRGAGNQWFYGQESDHGDVDLRHGSTGGGTTWATTAVSSYDDSGYRDVSSMNAGPNSRTATVRDPRMQPRTQTQQQQQPSQDQQSLDYRFQKWVDPSTTIQQPSILDRRVQPQPLSEQQHSLDPRRQAQPQQPPSLLSMNLQVPNNGSGFSNLLASRSRSEDQDSDQELYGGMGGSGSSRSSAGGAPTNPKRKWKQEYEAEEAQGTTKRWAVSTDDDSPPVAFQNTSDKDERPSWGRPASGNVRR